MFFFFNQKTAYELRISDWSSDVCSSDLADLIRRLQRQGRTAMVGDGINDAPALMQAEVAIAMGSGTDIAIDAADIIILNNRLANIVEAREISRYGYRKMVQNVSLAFLFNGIGELGRASGRERVCKDV